MSVAEISNQEAEFVLNVEREFEKAPIRSGDCSFSDASPKLSLTETRMSPVSMSIRSPR